MGKPLIHMIPSQESRLRDSLKNSVVSSSNSEESTPKEAIEATDSGIFAKSSSSQSGKSTKRQFLGNGRSWIKGNGMKRSTTQASNNSGKSSSSKESGLSSFVHSTASSTSSRSAEFIAAHKKNKEEMKDVDSPIVPDSIITTAKITGGFSRPVSSSSKVRIAIENYEEIIEITRKKSLQASTATVLTLPSGEKDEVSMAPSVVSQSSTPEKNETLPVPNQQAEVTESGSQNGSCLPGINLSSHKRSQNSGESHEILFTKEDMVADARNRSKKSHKFGDETTITSVTSYHSPTLDTSNVHTPVEENLGKIPKFEVLLEESSESESESDENNAEAEEPQDNGFEVEFNSPLDLPASAAAKNTRKAARKQPRPSRNRRNRQRQRSMSVKSMASFGTATASSESFFTAIDHHVATRKKSRRRKIPKNIIEVVPSRKTKKDVVIVPDDTLDATPEESVTLPKTGDSSPNPVLSPSKTKGQRLTQSVTAASLRVPPPLTRLPSQKKETKMTNKKTLREESKETTIEIQPESKEIVQQEAIEVKRSGSILFDQIPRQTSKSKEHRRTPSEPRPFEFLDDENVKKPYRLVRLEESNAVEVLREPCSKKQSKSLLPMGFLRKKKRSKTVTVARSVLRKPIKVISDDQDVDAIELLRESTNVGSSNTFSYDENEEEDSIIKRASPPPSPLPPVESLKVVNQENDIEIVAPSSKRGTVSPTLSADDSIGKIVSIQKLNSQDELVISSVSEIVKIPPHVPSKLSKEASTPPKKIEPVIETPSNRVEDAAAGITRESSYASQQASSVHSSSPDSSSGDAPAHETHSLPPQDMETETKGAENGDQLVFSDREQSIPKIEKAVFVPKIPASRKDTSCKNPDSPRIVANKVDETTIASSSMGGSRKVKIQIQGVHNDCGNIQNIETASVATTNSIEPARRVSSLVKKYSAMVVKSPSPTKVSKVTVSSSNNNGASESQHVVHVNVLGVAGIVVDRKNCRDVTGKTHSPSPPEQMMAVVGISESGQESIDNVTTFSSTLIHAPNTKTQNDAESPKSKHNEPQRHIAVWSSNYKGETPGSVVESKMLKMENDKAKSLNLSVALARDGEDTHHSAVIIGNANIEITEEMMRGGENRTMDVPIQQVVKEGPAILLKTISKYRRGIKKLRVEKLDSSENGELLDLSSAYAIDPAGDSMIRIQVSVKEVQPKADQGAIKKSGSSENQTAATERSEESSIRSNTSLQQKEGGEMYSKSLDFPDDFVMDDATFPTVSWKESVLTNKAPSTEEPEQPGCHVFGANVGIPSCTTSGAKQLDDRIEDMAEKVFSSTTCNAAPRDDSSRIRDGDTVTFATNNNTYYTGAPSKLLDDAKSFLGPVPTLNELRSLAKEFALTSGEYFFPEDPKAIQTKLQTVEDEGSVGSATLSAFERGELRSEDDSYSKESWKKRRGDDNATYSTGGSLDESMASLSLNRPPFGQEDVKFTFDRNRRVMSENNKFDIDTGYDDEKFDKNRTYNEYAGAPVQQLDVGCEGDDEESTLGDDRSPLIDGILEDEENKLMGQELGRERSGKASLPSLVENIAEVLSLGGKACGYVSADKADHAATSALIWNSSKSGEAEEIPNTVDQSDVQSVGELTAITLEKNEIKETSRKILMNRLGLPKDILAWSNGGKAKTSDDNDARESNADEEPKAGQENYFAEYERESSDVRSIYDNNSDVSKENDDAFTETQLKIVGHPLVEESLTKESSNQGTTEQSLRKIQEEDESEVESA